MDKPKLSTIYSVYVAALIVFLGFTVLIIFWAGYGSILAESAEPQRQQVKAILSRYHNEISLGQFEGLENDLKLQLVRLELGEIAVDFKVVGKRLTVSPAMSAPSNGGSDLWECRNLNELVLWDLFSSGCLATSVSVTYGPGSTTKLVEARWRARHVMENVRSAALKLIVLFGFVAIFLMLLSHFILSSRIIGPLSEVINSLREASNKKGLEQTIQNLDHLEARSSEMALLQSRLKEYLAEVQRFYDAKENLARGEARAEIAASLAHDIRSPAGALRIVLQKLAKKSGASAEELELGQKAIARIESITQSILTKDQTTKSSANDFDGDIEAAKILDVSELVLEVRDLLVEKTITYPLANFDFEAEVVPGARVYFNPSAMARILSNVINNSIESYGSKKPQVKLVLTTDQDHFSICVSDKGCGMSNELASKLGKMPVLETEKKAKEGSSGIALYHAHRILMNLGGDLSVSSTLGTGTVISIRLPLIVGRFQQASNENTLRFLV